MKASVWRRIHPFNMIVVLFLLFIVLRICLHGIYPLANSSTDLFSESVRTTQSSIGVMIRPIPSIVSDIQMVAVVENLNIGTLKKIRVGDKDITDPRMPIEIVAVNYAKSLLKPRELKGSLLNKESSSEQQKVRLWLRMPTFIYLDSDVSAFRLLNYKGKPIIGDKTYTFVGPDYSVSGPIVHVDDFIAGEYRPELHRIEIIAKSQLFTQAPENTEEIQPIYPGQRIKTPSLSKQLGTYVVIKKVLQIPEPRMVTAGNSKKVYRLKLLMECYCYKAKNGFKFDVSLGPIKAGELFTFNIGDHKMDLEVKRLRILPEK